MHCALRRVSTFGCELPPDFGGPLAFHCGVLKRDGPISCQNYRLLFAHWILNLIQVRVSPPRSPSCPPGIFAPLQVEPCISTDANRMTEHIPNEYSAVANDNLLGLVSVPDLTIADLPNELLEHIFVFNSLQNFQHLHDPAQTIRRTSHVCRRWRIIALNAPTLWAHIIDLESRSRWIELVLDRARSVPLDLILPSITRDLMDEGWAPTMLQNSISYEMIDLIPNGAPQVWHSLWILFDQELLEKCLRNARSFLLSISSSSWLKFLSPLVISYLPKLECLSLVTPERSSGLFGYRGEFIGGPPWRLRSLNLRKCSILFKGLSLPCLEELTVHHLSPTQALPPLSWLNILESLPKLKRLELINATATTRWINRGGNERFLHPRRVVKLPNMQWLRLVLPLPHCVNILENLVLPPACKLDLMTHGFSSLREEFYCLVDIVRQKVNAAEDAAFGDTVRLSISPSTFIVHALSEKDDYEPHLPSFYLSMTWKTAPDCAVPPYIDPFTVLRVMTAALRKLYESVTQLRIDLDVAAESRDRILVLTELLSNFNNLKHLNHVTPYTLPFLLSYIDVLSQPNRMVVGDDSEADYSKLLPLMNSISFLGVNFASLHPSEPNLLKNLLDFVTIRSPNLNVSPITSMSFQDCRAMSKKGINALTNAGLRLNIDESTCNNCNIRSGGPPLFGWRILLPLERVEWDLN